LKRKPRTGKTYGLPTFAGFLEASFARMGLPKFESIFVRRKRLHSSLWGFFHFQGINRNEER
jgi:hypothetical protein